ncbi:hypothetical protein DL769_008118 [Monosporascus sp. CRB-8-3]|nr:hypothetical protein DL769_008118 [Monosporascus sp. CRB-8-3]
MTEYGVEDAPLGAGLPPDDIHAVSVSLPRWEDAEGWARKDDKTLKAMKTGYPRFFIQPLVQRLAEELNTHTKPEDAACQVGKYSLCLDGTQGPTAQTPWTNIHIVWFGKEKLSLAKAFWQHTGEGISSSGRTAHAVIRNGPAFEDKRSIRDRIARFISDVPEELLIEHSFLYVDTIKILSKFGMNDVIVYGFGSASELDELEERLRSGTRIGALFTEFPTNPLLTCIDLHRVRRLADSYDFVVVCDDTVGTSINVDILQLVDVVVTSLTKLFSGACNVMGGSAILNPRSRHYGKLQEILSDIFEDTYFPEDAKIMARNCADFPQRVERINGNAQDVATFLQSRTDLVKHVYYPSIGPSKRFYDLVRRPDRGYGYLLSIEFVKPAVAVAFFDALRVAKGPSLGTNFTLACPYTLFAHYGEMNTVAAYGVVEHLDRTDQEKDVEVLGLLCVEDRAADVLNYVNVDALDYPELGLLRTVPAIQQSSDTSHHQPTATQQTVVVAVMAGPTLVQTSQKVLKGKANPLDESFEKIVGKALEEWHVPGLSIAVIDGDDTWAEGYGSATPNSTPVTPSTLFYTGSTTKAFTCAILAMMMESGDEGKKSPSLSALGWQTPISSLVRDDFVLQDEWATAHLTLEDALSHRTGFPRHDKALALRYGDDDHPVTMRDVARSLRHLPAVAEPRVAWRYCNYMYLVASHVIQTLTGRWLGTTMREWIWAPLGMKSTYFSLEDAQAGPEDLASGYYWDYQNGGGSLLREEGPVPKAAHAALKTPRMVMPPDSRKGFDAPMTYALGWMASTYKGHRVYTHGGGIEAYGADVFFPDLDYGVVAMGNTAITSNAVGELMAWKLINDKLGVPEEERPDWEGLIKKTFDEMLAAADGAVDRLYPGRADTPLPRALPLGDYAGTYFHAAYKNTTIEVIDNADGIVGKRELKTAREDFVWKMTFEFEHVSGGFRVIYAEPGGSSGVGTQLGKAEFKIGVTGKVEALKAEFLEDGSEGVVLFEKIA